MIPTGQDGKIDGTGQASFWFALATREDDPKYLSNYNKQ